ncbi:MAG: LLM class flavin-dependent oxidoreductase, partial [Acidimicrobiales bacterium]
GLGTAVLIPHLRHPMTQASAIATIDRLAPGRFVAGFGTGFTGRLVMDQRPLTWAYMHTYLTQLVGLLAGQVVEIDGKPCQMIHYSGLATPRPVDVPIVVSAFGPKGQGVAADIGAAGVMSIGAVEGFDWSIQMVNGTVLDDGEDLASPRVREAAGPWFTVMYHHMWHGGDPTVVDGLPGGAEWRAGIEAERPEGERHLAVHEGHCSHVTDRDRPLLEMKGSMFGSGMGWIGSADEVRAQAEAAVEAGSNELLYTPTGPDIERELRTFRAAVLSP